ncbi:MAG: monofunctional biosynthetic peptidoglycan transglycosylase [Deltaproteobacteria bacterium]|nr:monofunctional biosynthetic peptidoglycan transglycosylase [Deltaproteobacteria bacterium]
MPKIFKKLLRCIFTLLLLFLIVSIAGVLLLRFVNPPCTPLMLWRWAAGEGMRHEWRDLSGMAPALQQAVMAAEDQRFPDHCGFDWDQISRAMKENLKRKRPRGASTITMQTSRNLFLWQGGGLARKGLEAYFTLLLELFWPKARIIEVYLNIAEWGAGIFGAETASRAYFNRPASKLTAQQAALLAAVLPNPRHWSPAKPGSYVVRRAADIAADMRAFAPFKKKTYPSKGNRGSTTTQ